MKKFLFGLTANLMLAPFLFSEDITGFWKTINEETNKRQSVVAIYPYQNKYYGRLIVTFDNQGNLLDSTENQKERAKAVKGHPYYAGLDFIWDLEKEGDKYVNGIILDPEKGDEYAAEAWIEKGDLIVRGEILFLGKNQTWPKAEETDFPLGFKKPDLSKFVPVIPEVIEEDT